jgi:hypothetical protein
MHGQIETSHCFHDGHCKLIASTADGSSLAFDTVDDPHDERPLEGSKVQELRQRLVEHLRQEQHPDVDEHGLVKRQLPRPADGERRSRDTSGLAAAQDLGMIQRQVLPIH